MRFTESKKITVVLLTASKSFKMGMQLHVSQLVRMIDNVKGLHFDTSLIDLDLQSGLQMCKKAKVPCQLFLKLRNQFAWNLVNC